MLLHSKGSTEPEEVCVLIYVQWAESLEHPRHKARVKLTPLYPRMLQ